MNHGYARALAVLTTAVFALATPHAAWSADPEPSAGPMDITSTARGATLTVEAAERFASYGVPTDPADLSVLEYGDGRIVVVPASLVPGLDGEVRPDGEMLSSVDVGNSLTSRRQSGAGTPAERSRLEPAATGAYWSLREHACLASLDVDSARFDSCYSIYKLINDGSSSRSYWTLRQWGTAFEYEGGLRSAWISGTRTPGTTRQTWVDWGPEQGHTGACSSVNVGVSRIVSLSYSVQACETWSIDKSCNSCSPTFRTTWDCSCWFGLETKGGSPITRAVAYQMLVSMSNSATPRFRLGIGLAA